MDEVKALSLLERKVLWLATWMIHHANHVRPNLDGMKVGGHQASSASLSAIMTALYFSVLRPQDRVAVKPHASPIFHGIQYLLGRQTRAKMENFRGFGGAQSYPSRTKDGETVDISTGSVGLGAAFTIFGSLMQDHLEAKGALKGQPLGRFVALVGDAELDEGNIFEALLEGWKHGLRNCWWIIDYNRQSLDAIVREGLHGPIVSLFKSVGWDIVVLKYGDLLEEAFAEPGGDVLRDWIDRCPNQLYSTLAFQGGAAWRARLLDEIGDQGPVSALIERRSDEALAALMTNLAGHDMAALLRSFRAIDHDRPVCFLAYTIKGYGLPLQGHKDNHSGLMTIAQTETLRDAMQIRAGHEWDKFEGLTREEAALTRFLTAVPFAATDKRHHKAATLALPDWIPAEPSTTAISTQHAFGQLMHALARSDGELAARVLTMSPDVTVSTNLGAWVNRRGLFGRRELVDLFRAQRVPSTQKWDFGPAGQHLELGIAEMNLFLALGAAGLTHSLFGERLIPIGTLYDPFIARGLDALNYACYQDARFILVATPSGVTLAPEGGAHQSISSPLIGMAQPGLVSFEPAYAEELAVILQWSFGHVQDDDGGSVYLRLSTRTIDQPRRPMTANLARQIVEGGYWLRPPGPNPDLIVAYSGAIAPEAIEAVGLMAEDRRDIGLLAITSADRLYHDFQAACRAREAGDGAARSAVEQLLCVVPQHCGVVSVVDGHPAGLGWLGSVRGHRQRALGVERFGQTGTAADLYRHNGIDAAGIVRAGASLSRNRPIRHLRHIA
jgi:pyruvate dehydrogenase E1 component